MCLLCLGGRSNPGGGPDTSGEIPDPTTGEYRDPAANFGEVWKIVVAVFAGIHQLFYKTLGKADSHL